MAERRITGRYSDEHDAIAARGGRAGDIVWLEFEGEAPYPVRLKRLRLGCGFRRLWSFSFLSAAERANLKKEV